ncbi:MAG: signal peptide peptidase SppA [Acidobacteriota bacterium]
MIEPGAPASPPAGPAASSPPPPRAKSRTPIFFVGALSGCLLVFVGLIVFGVFIAASKSGETTGDVFSTQKIAIIPIEGEIFEARDTLELLHRYEDNATVKAIVMRINSPGGAIAPSQEIYEAVRNARKPVVASLDSVAASGGFYIAAGCDRIVANPGSITGSIGVILEWMNTKDLVAWAKMKPEVITSGALKAAGAPFLDLSDAERAYFQSIVDQLHSQFVRAVAAGRKGKITEAEVAKLADGRVFTGEQALSLKLVDEMGNLDDAVRAAAKLAGISGTPGTIYPRKKKPGLFDLLSDSADSETALARIFSRRPRFLYRW